MLYDKSYVKRIEKIVNTIRSQPMPTTAKAQRALVEDIVDEHEMSYEEGKLLFMLANRYFA